ncbi:hypothetical protein [Nocardia asteroides]|uniref:hypothetical protein n=1 Tax=Nocardia asteroides TaxID=1824 RepID=UPI0034280EBF
MFAPDPIQSQLLMSVQNIAFDSRRLIDRSRAEGDLELSPFALAHLDLNHRTREALEVVATAVGVPKSVIDYTRACGDRGYPWRPGQPLLSTEAIRRSALLAGHQRALTRLQEMAGIGAAIAARPRVPRAQFVAFRKAMGVSWQRVGALGHALALTETERTRLWEPRAGIGWATSVAQTVAGLDRSELAARWRTIVDTDFTTAAIPVVVLQEAGITADDISRQLPIGPDRMVELAAAALDPQPSLSEVAGSDIEAAIRATATESHTEPDISDHAAPPPRHHGGPDLAPGPDP